MLTLVVDCMRCVGGIAQNEQRVEFAAPPWRRRAFHLYAVHQRSDRPVFRNLSLWAFVTEIVQFVIRSHPMSAARGVERLHVITLTFDFPGSTKARQARANRLN